MAQPRWTPLVMVLSLLFISISATGAQPQPAQWVDHALPVGGVLALPADFTIVERPLDPDADALLNGVTDFSQFLMNAKGLNDGVVNSIKVNRHWRQDDKGNVLKENATEAEEAVRSVPKLLSQRGTAVEVIDGPRPFSIGAVTGWRVSLKFNNGVSRMDHFAVPAGPILYTLNAAYAARGAAYWSSKTDEIVGRWQPDSRVGDLSAIAKVPPSTEWQAVVAQTGEQLSLPSSWVVIARDGSPELETENGQTSAIRRLLNIRPTRTRGDVSVVQIYSLSIQEAASSRPIAVSDAGLAEMHEAMVGGAAPLMTPSSAEGTITRQVAGAKSYVTPLVSGSTVGIRTEGLFLSTVRGDRAYLIMATFPPGQAAEFEATITQVLDRSVFIPSAEILAIPTTVPAGPVGARLTSDSSWDLTSLFVSALLTWGIGLAPPLLIRYAVLRRPILSRIMAGAIAGSFLIVNVVVFVSLGSKSKTHAALMLVCLASYHILRQGAPRSAAVAKGAQGLRDPHVTQAAQQIWRDRRNQIVELEARKPDGWKEGIADARRVMREMEMVLPAATVMSLHAEQSVATVPKENR